MKCIENKIVKEKEFALSYKYNYDYIIKEFCIQNNNDKYILEDDKVGMV